MGPHFLRLLLALAAGPATAAAADPLRVERAPAKEPVYRGEPKYCLLAFGPDAKTRVWLVLDAGTLYVDRNADGDLTEVGERVPGKPHPQVATAVLFQTGPLAAAGLAEDTRLEVQLEENLRRKARLVIVSCRARGRPAQRAAADPAGLLAFGDAPKSVPVIHFHGPLTLSPRAGQALTRGRHPKEWEVVVGSPGSGSGTFARVAHEDIPAGVHPVAEFEFPTGAGGSEKVKVVLEGRC